MPRSDLTTKDLRGVLDVVYAINEHPAEVEMPSQVLVQIGSLVGCDSVSYNRIEHTTNRLLSSVIEPSHLDISGLSAFHAAWSQHPGLAAYRAGRLAQGTSAALTDLAPLAVLHRLPLYADFYRPRGVVDQLICAVQVDNQQGIALTFNRARCGFSVRDRTIVNLAAPHLYQAVICRQRFASMTAAIGTLRRHSVGIERSLPRLSNLTPREQEIVEHVMVGLTDRETARSLRISPRTVHKHLENTYRKLGLTNRVGLVALLHRSVSSGETETGVDRPA